MVRMGAGMLLICSPKEVTSEGAAVERSPQCSAIATGVIHGAGTTVQ